MRIVWNDVAGNKAIFEKLKEDQSKEEEVKEKTRILKKDHKKSQMRDIDSLHLTLKALN